MEQFIRELFDAQLNKAINGDETDENILEMQQNTHPTQFNLDSEDYDLFYHIRDEYILSTVRAIENEMLEREAYQNELDELDYLAMELDDW